MGEPNTKRRYIIISGGDLPPLTCPVDQLADMLPEFIGDGIGDPMDPITLTETWLTDEQYESLGDWSP